MMKMNAATLALAVAFVGAASGQARAQGFISPFMGYNYGGDAGCPSLTNCEDKHRNIGIGIGKLGNGGGFEQEFAYTKNFFGETPGVSSNVLTVMSNFMIGPKLGPVQPYGLLGLGLIKARVELKPTSLLTSNNNFGWDIGGGVIAMFGGTVGIRGDIRYFHSFNDVDVLGVSLGKQKLDFGRASAGLVLKF